MTSDLTTIRNIGPAIAASLIGAGVPDAATFRRLGADAAYLRLVASGERPHFIVYYVLHMALQGRPWNDCKGEEKDEMRARFDALMAGARQRVSADGLPSGIVEELDRLGLRSKPA